MRKTTAPQTFRRGTAAAFLSLAATLVCLGQPAAAQPASGQASTCGAREALLDRLALKYEEQPVSLGVTATGSLLEVLASPSGSWTIIVTIPNGPTCLVSSGEGWRSAPIQLAEEPAV